MQHLQPNTTLQGGKYRIERVLGQGGFGITYLAKRSSNGSKVAIKELFVAPTGQAINSREGNEVIVTNISNQEEFEKHKSKFKKEAERLSKFKHRNLVKVSDYFEENGTAYYVMQYIEGESLRSKLNREGALSESLVIDYIKQLLSALEVIHREKIWHLDIKPDNIMVDGNDNIFLIDFGASKHIVQSGTLTTSSMMLLTRGYYPPEQISPNMRNIGSWTDIYALGATIYNLLTKKAPPSFDSIFSEGRNAFSFTSMVSSSMRDLIIKMMNPNRKERLQSVFDVRELLNKEEKQKEEEKHHQKIPKKGYTRESIRNTKKFKCLVCGYEYDPSMGDPDNGIKLGTPFESLPDSWECPICGVGKDDFTIDENKEQNDVTIVGSSRQKGLSPEKKITRTTEKGR